MMSGEFELDVLAVAPHPDDAELCCGGTLIQLADLGYSTGILDLTRGEMSSNGSVETRAAESAAAADVLRLTLRENLGLPDTRLNPNSGYDGERLQPEGQLMQVVRALRRLRPELLLIPWHADRHPDHRAASELLRRAVFFAALKRVETEPRSERFSPRQVLYYQMRERFRPSFVVDISAVSKRKREAAGCYLSQFGRASGATETLINAPLALEALEARDRYYGASIGVTHGEPFLCRGTLGLADPLDHFRRNAFGPAHLFESDVQ